MEWQWPHIGYCWKYRPYTNWRFLCREDAHMSITNIAIDFWIFSHCVNVSTAAALTAGAATVQTLGILQKAMFSNIRFY